MVHPRVSPRPTTWGVAAVTVLVLIPGQALAGDGPRPFSSSGSSHDATFDPEVPAGRCIEMAGTADAIATFRFTGTATHLGRIDVVASHCSDLDTGRYGDGQFTVTAANGDLLFGTYFDGESDPSNFPVVEFTDQFELTGGTGRFAHASGSGSEAGTFNLLTSEFTIEMDGWISYDASDRSS